MITNERQYKITRAEAEKFKDALDDLKISQSQRTDIHPRLLQAERDALESQLEELVDEIEQYEALRSAKAPVIEINDFSQLADGLIRARIASGLSQKDLADRLGVKQQQIQRYESEKYAGASLKRLMEIVDALGIRITNDILIPFEPVTFLDIEKKVSQVGLDTKFLFAKLMSTSDAAIYKEGVEVEGGSIEPAVARLATVFDRIYGWSRDNLFGPAPLSPPRLAAGEARFKMPARRKQTETSVYAAYAHYLALVVLNAMPIEKPKTIPDDPKQFRRMVKKEYGEITLRTVLHFAWDLGAPVLPLSDGGVFHGACWRYGGRNIIVLKQRSKFVARWLFDLIHELYHAAQRPDEETFEVIEADETSEHRRESDEEILASQFAGEVILDERADLLAQKCVEAAKGSVERLKGVVPEIAESEGVDLGALANYLAFRLSWQGINWWGAASNLQKKSDDPWLIARDVFFERFSFEVADTLDRELLERALESE